MNPKQRASILIGILFALVVGLFPPWKTVFRYEGAGRERSLGHYFIFAPPSIEDVPYVSFYGIRSDLLARKFIDIRIDTTGLLISWFLVFLLMVGGVLVLQDEGPLMRLSGKLKRILDKRVKTR
jgi:hypothetical protein